jgi:hypothetical protein
MSIAPNQTINTGFPVTAASSVTLQFSGSDFAAGTVGKINWMNVTFTGHAAITAANGMGLTLQDNSATITYFVVRVNRANAVALDIPGNALFNITNMNLLYTNGLQCFVSSNTAGDSGNFLITMGYDRTF